MGSKGRYCWVLRNCGFLVICSLTAGFTCGSLARSEEPNAEVRVAASDLGKNVNVIGDLGIPLGTVTEITIEIVDGNATQAKGRGAVITARKSQQYAARKSEQRWLFPLHRATADCRQRMKSAARRYSEYPLAKDRYQGAERRLCWHYI